MQLFILSAFYLLTIVGLIIYLFLRVIKRGLDIYSLFLATFCLFYFLVPFFSTVCNISSIDDVPYSILFDLLTVEKKVEIFCQCLFFLILIMVIYNFLFFKRKSLFRFDYNSHRFKKIVKVLEKMADFLFLISGLGIFLLILESGSFSSYLALGSQTRGLDKNPEAIISGGYLQLVTLSTFILTPPYLYACVYKINKRRFVYFKLIVAILFALIFLIQNQGRAPLILFFLPFIIQRRKIAPKKIFLLTGLFILALISLPIFDSIFNYVSYGSRLNFIQTIDFNEIFGEFSYPFTNFAYKEYLVKITNFHFFKDFILAPFYLLPNSLLKIIGFNKNILITLPVLHTEAMSQLAGILPKGGIPVDFLTFGFYQVGQVGLIIYSIITGFFLYTFDKIGRFFSDREVFDVIFLRIIFTVVNTMNNGEIISIIRNRIDVVMLLIIVLVIYYYGKGSESFYEIEGEER